MRTFRKRFHLFLALAAICLAVAIPLSLVLYTDESTSEGRVILVIIGAILVSFFTPIVLMLACSTLRWAYSCRRRPLARLAILVLDAARLVSLNHLLAH